MNAKPSDGDIHDVLVIRSGETMPTYYIKNILRRRWPGLQTAWVLRRLKALEKAGKVRRVASNYAQMICWDVARSTPAPDGDLAELAESGL